LTEEAFDALIRRTCISGKLTLCRVRFSAHWKTWYASLDAYREWMRGMQNISRSREIQGRRADQTQVDQCCASGHHTSTFAAHIAFDEHAKIRRDPGRHTALVKDPAVLRGREIRLQLWPCSGQE